MPVRLLLVVGTLLTSAACATSGTSPRPFPTPGERPASRLLAGAPAPIVVDALALRGTPYRNGGDDPSGFDCSGFVQYVFHRHALLLPRSVETQAREGHAVRPTEIRPGDLVFFSTVAPGPTHVGIAIGGGEFVHAPSSRGVVRVERLDSGYWAERLVAARRVLP